MLKARKATKGPRALKALRDINLRLGLKAPKAGKGIRAMLASRDLRALRGTREL